MADIGEPSEPSRQESSGSAKHRLKDLWVPLVVAGITVLGGLAVAGIGVLGAMAVARSTNDDLQDNLTRTLEAQQHADERDSQETAYAEFITAFRQGVEAYEAARFVKPRRPTDVPPPINPGNVGTPRSTPDAQAFAARLLEFDGAADEIIRTGTLVRMFGSELMGEGVAEAIEEFRIGRCVLTFSNAVSCRRAFGLDLYGRTDVDFDGVLDRILAQARDDLGIAPPPTPSETWPKPGTTQGYPPSHPKRWTA